MEPASSIIRTLGGADSVAEICGVHRTRVYKWCKPKDDAGTDGLIPHWHIRKILDHAESEGLPIEAADFYPKIEKGAA